MFLWRTLIFGIGNIKMVLISDIYGMAREQVIERIRDYAEKEIMNIVV